MVGRPPEKPLWTTLISAETWIRVRVMHGAFAGAVGAAVLAGTANGRQSGEGGTVPKQ